MNKDSANPTYTPATADQRTAGDKAFEQALHDKTPIPVSPDGTPGFGYSGPQVAPRGWWAWNDDPRMEDRSAAEVAAMRYFPGFKIYREPDGARRWYWAGQVKSDSGHTYDLEITYPDNFPVQSPVAFIPNLPLKNVSELHRFKDGQLCLFKPGERGIEPGQTAADIVRRAALWVRAYEFFCRNSYWPGPAASH